MKRVMVTGCAGFIGSKTVAALLEDPGVEVVGIDCITDYYSPELKRNRLAEIDNSRFEWHEVDIRSESLKEHTAELDGVIHLAGQPGVRPSWGKSFDNYVAHNVSATQALLELISTSSPLAKVVYASSSSVYGDAMRYPTVESDVPRPVSPYGVTKLAGEHLVSLYAKKRGLSAVSLRYFTVYGPGQRPDMAFTRLAAAAVARKPFGLFGDGSQVRDFTYVDDVVAANLLALTNQQRPGAVYNIAGGSQVSMRTCIDLVSALTGSPVALAMSDPMAGDVKRTSGGTEAATTELGWLPRISIEEGLAAQVEWVRDNLQTVISSIERYDAK
ncbi:MULTISPECIES: NAD-dependent epimerase/dehydratase family protein [Nocardiaceae]|uniref:Nucleoside-diphosphate-sugar epimerase n=1 Tax=Rhodococcoides corynebacterioides TaxID=53972 RepID=A0ABS2KZ95_9NOCA|nr:MULTISPECIES: NAD-dependent epimerase/dehydratase family protein [Rhodococcus]MBM7417244.1 nucleoside-diphosphate-sugar epimerase [Rhodococcus corynebacterioides]MBP1115497.1 nucleoside-diphosphate-sugar epimerase [Rhodococcus sp. PvP016]